MDWRISKAVGQANIIGDGSKIEVSVDWTSKQPPSIDEELRSGRSLDEIMAERGLEWESPENLDNYKSDGR